MNMPLLFRRITLVAIIWVVPSAARAQAMESQIVAEAGQVLQEIMAIPAKGIPQALLSDAQGIVIIPGMIRGGFIVGVKHGRGIAVARDSNGAWTNPVFVRISGGNIGFQAGVQATDLILVFRNRARVDEMLRGRFTIGANAGAAAGPIGRGVTAATDAQLRAEILSYSRSRGLFAGVSIDGAVIQPEATATATFYGQTAANPRGHAPPAASHFLAILNSHSTPIAANATPAPIPVPHADHERVGRQLLAAHNRLLEVLDPTWQQHLALPADFMSSTPQAQQNLRNTLARFNQVAGDAQFKALTERQEFQETLTLLNRHALLQEAATANVVSLPPPPPR